MSMYLCLYIYTFRYLHVYISLHKFTTPYISLQKFTVLYKSTTNTIICNCLQYVTKTTTTYEFTQVYNL